MTFAFVWHPAVEVLPTEFFCCDGKNIFAIALRN